MEEIGCYGCGKTFGITVDCICDPNGLEYMDRSIVFRYTREGREDRIVPLSENQLGILQFLLDYFDNTREDSWDLPSNLRELFNVDDEQKAINMFFAYIQVRNAIADSK